VLLLAALLLTRGLTARFNGWHDHNSAMYGQFARNHVEYGLRATALYCTWGDTLAPPAPPQRYVNHPPLIALWVAVPLVLLGDHEWAARLVPIAASLGSACLTMVILGRLAGNLVGVLAGFFFSTLPLTAYFGRMIDHVAPAQFFSLLMLHGYLEWTATYPGRCRRARGASLYAAAAVLGIGTAWACVLAALLIGTWHAVRVVRRAGEARILIGLAAAPALGLAAVLLHILAATGWDLGMLGQLARSRSVGGVGGGQPWSAWLGTQARTAVRNFTLPGVAAALASVLVWAARSLRGGRNAVLPGFALRGDAAVASGLLGLQGALYLLLFKNAAWFHDYWQFFLGPFVAASMAAVALALRDVAAAAAPRAGRALLVLLLVVPLPGLAATLRHYASAALIDPEHVEALAALEPLLPRRAPAWTSRPVQATSETLSGHTNTWPHPTVAYYAHRPLHFSRDEREIIANSPGCAAYVLRRDGRAWSRDLEQALAARYRVVRVGERHTIFLLGEPLSRAAH
jgi:4-amino-4-deoxy-L-arabinose transferase-like glycosyltransferase